MNDFAMWLDATTEVYRWRVTLLFRIPKVWNTRSGEYVIYQPWMRHCPYIYIQPALRQALK